MRKKKIYMDLGQGETTAFSLLPHPFHSTHSTTPPEFLIIRFMISAFSPIFFIEISIEISFVPLPPLVLP